MKKALKDLKIYDKKNLLVFSNSKKSSKDLILSARNIKNLTYVEVRTLNAYDVLSNQNILFFEEALINLKTHYLTNEK